MKKKMLLFVTLIFFSLVPNNVFGEEEEKELEIRELSEEYDSLYGPISSENLSLLYTNDEVVIINQEIIIYNDNDYHYEYDPYFLFSLMTEGAVWNIINKDLIVFSYGNTTNIYDIQGNLVDQYYSRNEKDTVLSYNPELMDFVSYDFTEEELREINREFKWGKNENVWFIVSNSPDTRYRLLGYEEFGQFYVDTYTGERISEIFTYYNSRNNSINGWIYLYKTGEKHVENNIDSLEMAGNALYDLDGNVIIPYTSNKIGETRYRGGFIVYNITDYYASIRIEGKYGIFDIKNRQMLIEPMYDNVFQIDDRGYFVVKKGNKYGMVDANNTVMFGFDYDRIHIDGNYIAIGWDNMVQLLDFSWNKRTDVYCQNPNEEIGNCKTSRVFLALDLSEPFLLLYKGEPNYNCPLSFEDGIRKGYPQCDEFFFYDKNGYNAFHSKGINKIGEYYYDRERDIYDVYGNKILNSFDNYYFGAELVSYHNKKGENVLFDPNTRKDLVTTTGEFVIVSKESIVIKEGKKLKIYDSNGTYLGFIEGDDLTALGKDIFVLSKDGKYQIIHIHISDIYWNENVEVVIIKAPISIKEEILIVNESEEVKPVTVEKEEESEIVVKEDNDYTALLVFVLLGVSSGGYVLYKTGYYKKILDMIKKKVEKTKNN